MTAGWFSALAGRFPALPELARLLVPVPVVVQELRVAAKSAAARQDAKRRAAISARFSEWFMTSFRLGAGSRRPRALTIRSHPKQVNR